VKPDGVLAWLDDRLNPIVVKELRQAVQSRLVTSALVLFLVLQAAILSIFLTVPTLSGPGRPVVSLRAGQDVFLALHGLLLAGGVFFIPAYTGLRLGVERTETNVDLLFISSLSPRSIVAGKLLAAMVLALMLFSASAPFMTLTYLMRGVDLPTILLILAIDFAAMVAATQAAILAGAASGNRGVKAGMGFAVAGGLMQLYTGAMFLCVGLIQEGSRLPLSGALFWAVVGTAAATVVLLTALQFFWSAAILSPSSSNRALPVRLYMLFLWAAGALLAGGWSLGLNSSLPVLLVGTLGVLQSCLQLGIAINERETWGARVARTIPRGLPLRAPAFLLYSGSAGGVLFALLLLGLTVAACSVWLWARPDPMLLDAATFFYRLWALLALFTWCYALSGVLVRRLLHHWVKPMHTWVVGSALLFLCSALPYLILYFLYPESPRRPLEVEQRWLAVNPFYTVPMMVASERAGLSREVAFSDYCLTFLGCWAALAALLCAPWFYGQMRRFRPGGARAT
jgi:hypothetical protein